MYTFLEKWQRYIYLGGDGIHIDSSILPIPKMRELEVDTFFQDIDGNGISH